MCALTCTIGPFLINKPDISLASSRAPPPLLRKSRTSPSILNFFIVGIIAMIIVGFSETGRWSLGQAMMMDNAGEEYRARVISLLMMTWGMMPISMIPMGWAYGYFGAEITTFVTAIITLVFSITSIYWAKSLSKL